MKNSNEKNFERELPTGYKQALYINAKSAKFGIIFNLISIFVWFIVMAAAIFSLRFKTHNIFDLDIRQFWLAYLIFLVSMVGYIVLHELAHGAAYKTLTGEKLTFGMSWSCAFCGVPNIFTYRKTAIISTLSPFVVFTVLFIPILIVLYCFSPVYYLVAACIFGIHLGGCSGDLYVFCLLATKFKDRKTLMRDTGPEQFFYVIEK